MLIIRGRFRPSQKLLRKNLSLTEKKQIARRPDTSKLEKRLFQYLKQMPQITVRGSSDKSIQGSHAFLISSTPIRSENEKGWLLSPEEIEPLRLFHKLYSTIAVAADYGNSYMNKNPESKKLMLSFHHQKFRIAKGDLTLSVGRFPLQTYHSILDLLKPAETTFPVSIPGIIPLGQLEYTKSAISLFFKKSTSIETSAHLKLKLYALLYRNTLRLLIKLAENNWEE